MKFKSLAILALTVAACAPALADEYGMHPFYLHAISDLRAAAWQVDHRRPEDGQISQDEKIVHDELAAAIGELERAAYTDGKSADWQPPPDAMLNRDGRLHAAVDLLRKAHADVARQEDDPRARGAQQRALQHMELAERTAERAIGDVRHRKMGNE